jgi:hypothetical protein
MEKKRKRKKNMKILSKNCNEFKMKKPCDALRWSSMPSRQKLTKLSTLKTLGEQNREVS